MAKRLLVEGLDWGVTEGQLMRVFTPFGDLDEARIAIDWETGRSRGFGYVTFRDSGDAEAAMAGLDGQKLAGKTLRVMVAPEQVPGRAGAATPPAPEARPAYRGGDYGYADPADTKRPGDQPRTDRKLFRSADFGYVEAKKAPEPAAPAIAATPANNDTPGAKKQLAPKGPPAKTADPEESLDDGERANRAKFGGWRENEENDQGRGGGGSPFG
jgi:cold-inducible RNA-binding protein